MRYGTDVRVCLFCSNERFAPAKRQSIWAGVFRAFQCRLRVQKSQIFMPHVQHSLLEGRRHTSHVTTSCVRGSQCSPMPSNSFRRMSSPPCIVSNRHPLVNELSNYLINTMQCAREMRHLCAGPQVVPAMVCSTLSQAISSCDVQHHCCITWVS